jgi:hypothetical protein
MPNLVRFWILLSALLVGAGWILSGLHQLNRIGYAVVFALAGAAFFFWRRKTKWRPQKTPAQLFQKCRRRFKRPAPRFFLLLVVLAFLSATLLPDLNYDTDAYRLPRVLHWLWAGQWHWIHTFDPRMNIAGCGFEWLCAPLVLFTHTDRFLFLINWFSYLLLPGLIFSVFTRLQVRPRVAWWWMWLLAAGWCYALQAGSVDNDSLAAVYILAAVDLALRAREKNAAADLWLSLLAAALATGVKQTNLPLALLWLIAAWPGARLFWARPVASLVVAALGVLVSVVPVSLLNYQHYGTWLPLNVAGLPSAGKFALNPFWGVVGNAFCIPLQNLMPPFFPWIDEWGAAMQRFAETPFGRHFSSFESFGALRPGVGEVNAGIGLGICFLTVISFFGGGRHQANIVGETADETPRWLRRIPWFLLLVFMAKNGAFENARQLAPYYVFLFPVMLVGRGQIDLVRQAWWRWLGLLTMVATVGLVMTQPNHPLFPAQALIARLQMKYPGSKPVSLAARVYGYQRSIESQRRSLRAALPPDAAIGYAAGVIGRCEPWLWWPAGQRRVERVAPGDPPERIRSEGIFFVVVEDQFLEVENKTLAQWLAEQNGVLEKVLAPENAFSGNLRTLYLVRLRINPPPEPAR